VGRLSPTGKCIIINCDSRLHQKFYYLKKRAHVRLCKNLKNREFLDYLLNLFIERLTEEEKRRVLTSY
jgi:hypothetical protein